MTRAAELHRRAMELADLAFSESVKGNALIAARLYRDAFTLERDASAEAIRSNLGEPTVSVLHRSAATLALDVGEVREAERLVATALALEPPDSTADELRDLLEQVYFRRHLSLRGVELSRNEFQLTLIGEAVGSGMVLSDEFVDRVKTVEKLVYVTAARKRHRPFRDDRKRYEPVQREIDLYVSVPRAASFAITFRIGSKLALQPTQNGSGFSEAVVEELLTCFDLLDRGDYHSIEEQIDDPAYYRNFVDLASEIAPDGSRITAVGFTAIGAKGAPREVALHRVRDDLPTSKALAAAERAKGIEPGVVTITGRLEWASNRKRANEIRVAADQGIVYRVQVPSGALPDIVRRLWEENVIVQGFRKANGVVALRSIDKVAR